MEQKGEGWRTTRTGRNRDLTTIDHRSFSLPSPSDELPSSEPPCQQYPLSSPPLNDPPPLPPPPLPPRDPPISSRSPLTVANNNSSASSPPLPSSPSAPPPPTSTSLNPNRSPRDTARAALNRRARESRPVQARKGPRHGTAEMGTISEESRWSFLALKSLMGRSEGSWGGKRTREEGREGRSRRRGREGSEGGLRLIRSNEGEYCDALVFSCFARRKRGEGSHGSRKGKRRTAIRLDLPLSPPPPTMPPSRVFLDNFVLIKVEIDLKIVGPHLLLWNLSKTLRKDVSSPPLVSVSPLDD